MYKAALFVFLASLTSARPSAIRTSRIARIATPSIHRCVGGRPQIRPASSYPRGEDLRRQEGEREELSHHCFGPSCNIDEYDFLQDAPMKKKPYPTGGLVRRMEAARKRLSDHCFGPSCNIDHYDFIEGEPKPKKPLFYPVYSMVRKMENARKKLADHCFGPSCSIDSYDNI
mmetsp:Transcript_5097/g.7863  ORF Transcript_5097/g.7863 Transcript_5097/m.7863 type:complete len:172 (-) Transcript_5097:250-765(-)